MVSIKSIIKLQRLKKERIKKNLIIVEGVKEINMAIKGKLKLVNILICKKIFFKKNNLIPRVIGIIFIKDKDYKKISYRKNTEGIVGIFKRPSINNKKFVNYLINKKGGSVIIILENIEKPGNLGAIIRTVESVSIVDCIIIPDNKDIYSPNIIRASLGCVFIFPILIIPFKKILKYFGKKFYFFGTSIIKNKSLSLYRLKFNKSKKVVIIFGNESVGVSNRWDNILRNNINIPMYGKINSLNVSVSVSIIIFEILRQRISN